MAAGFVTGVGGKSFQSVKPNLNAALYQQLLINKCRELDRCFTECSTRDLHSFLPHLLSNIFGYDQTVGWMLKSLHPTTNRDSYNAVLYFLSVDGPLFRLIHRLEAEEDIYEFPISHLPGPTQDLVHSGGLPSFCTIRQQSAVHDGFVLTNPFEYYFCHFAYFLIHARNVAQPWIGLQDCLYTVLADRYMAHLLPARDIIQPSHPPSPPHLSPATPPPPQSTPSQHSPPLLGLLKMTPTAGYQTPRHTADQTLWRSKVFLQILVEFWLTQCRYEAVSRFDLILHNQFKPSEEHIRLVRLLMKRVHYFANGFSVRCADSHLVTITDNLRSSVIPVHFRSSLYFLLLHALKHWSFDVTYRYVVELWLTFIQPWRYLDPEPMQFPQANNRRPDPVDQRWEPFILSNLHFYTNLLGEFLNRAPQLNLKQKNDVDMLARVAKVFAQPGLVEYCRKGQEQRSFSSFIRPSSPSSSIHEDNAALDVVPLFFTTSEEAERLLFAVHEAKCHTERQIEASLGRRRLPPPTSTASHQTTSPPSTPNSGQGWMATAWQWLTDEAGGSSMVGSAPTATVDAWKKTVQHFQAIEENLCSVFQLPPVDVAMDGIDGEDGSPVLTQRRVPPGGSPPDAPRRDLSHSQIEPEYEEAHCTQLSPLGREQVKAGLRTCSGRRVAIRGDPLLQPIRSYENATLVRALYSVSSYLTDKFSTQLQAIGCSNRLACKLLRELLAPPPPGSALPTSEALRTPIRQVVPVPVAMVTRPSHPRVTLRVFASYFTLLYLGLALLLGYLLNLGVTSHVVIALLVVFFYTVISYRSKGATS